MRAEALFEGQTVVKLTMVKKLPTVDAREALMSRNLQFKSQLIHLRHT